MFIFTQQKHVTARKNLFQNEIQSFQTEKAPNCGPYQDTTVSISRRNGRNESQTT